jgi:hypothetical protein
MTRDSWIHLAWAALGVGSIIVGAMVPATAPYLIPTGAGLLGLAIPTPGKTPAAPKD